MGQRQHDVSRRTVLAGFGAAALGSTVAAGPASAQEDDETTFVVEQAGECVQITPLSGDEPVEDFYDWDVWRTDYSSAGTQDLQDPDTSTVFLYRGPDDRLSLVLVHGALDSDEDPDDGEGGSVTMAFADLPADGEWSVRDDLYDGSTNYDRWQVEDEPQRVDWTWAGYRTDGGAYGPLGSSFEVTIEPAFNQEAALYGEQYEGDVVDWEVLSDDRADPDRTALALDEPITLRTGSCESDEADLLDGVDGVLDVDVVPPIVNPDSRGVLPVDVGLPDELSFDDIVVESIQTVPGGLSPDRVIPAVGGRGDARLFFSTPDLDLSGDGSTTLAIEAETTDGQTVDGESSVRLVPNADEEEAEEAAEDAEEDAEDALEEAEEDAEEALEEAEERAEEEFEDDDGDDDGDDDDGDDNGDDDAGDDDGDDDAGDDDGDDDAGDDDGDDGDRGLGRERGGDDADGGGSFDDFEELFGDDDDEDEDDD